MDGNLSRAGTLARSPPPFVFDAFVLLYSHFLSMPVRNVTNRAKTSGMRQRDGPFALSAEHKKGIGVSRCPKQDA